MLCTSSFELRPCAWKHRKQWKNWGFLSQSVSLSLFFFPLSTLKSILLHFPFCLLAVLPYNSRPTSSLLFFFYFGRTFQPAPLFHPPHIAPSSTSFSLCLSCLLAQSLNLLEPRDPVCYVNGLNTDTHVLIYCMHTLMPAHTNPLFTTHVHTYMHTRTVSYMAKLGFAAFGRRSTLSRSPLSLTS